MAAGDRQGERIKIVYLIWNLKPAGAERQLLELLRGLDRDRFEPYLVVFKASALQADCSCPVAVIDTKRSRWGRIAGGLLGFLKLLIVLRRMRPHLVHSFLPELTLVYGAAATKLLGIPVFVCSRRASVDLYPRTALMRWAERLALKFTDAVAVNARFLMEELVTGEQFPREKIALIPNGVESTLYKPALPSRRVEVGWPAECCVIGMVANFRTCKRHDLFIEAAWMVREISPETRFLMVGDDLGTLRGTRRMIVDAGLESAMHIVSGCSRPEDYYGTMDMLVCTSDTEGLSNALLEGMACGLPVIATAVGGNAELVHDGVNGILVPAGTAAASGAAITRLVRDPELRRNMGAAGRRAAMEQFSMAAMVSGYESLYADLLAPLRLGVAGAEPVPSGTGNRAGGIHV